MASSLILRRLSATLSKNIKTCNTISRCTIAASNVVTILPPTKSTHQLHYFSSDSSGTGSHDDFAPKRKPIADQDEALKLIHDHVTSNRIMLYMKGNPSMPMCGFSARVVKILQQEGVDFSSVNVLDYPTIREGVKKYSDWPTIPQLYVNGEFIGGCDIVTSLHESGELADLFKQEKTEQD